ncbi:hypothetical protein [Methylobacterium fujisawaense]|uniref:hypothetical protein n=1 Tax=Methylobacterium fujisawaense TaxID=107400 RepID=UPI00313F223F
MIDVDLAQRLWFYANRAADSAHQLDPGQGESAGPLLAAEMVAAGIRAALIGLALLSDEEVGDFDKLPSATLPIARALEKANVRAFTQDEIEYMVLLDRVCSTGIDRHFLDQAVCRAAYRNASYLASRLAEDLRAALPKQTAR